MENWSALYEQLIDQLADELSPRAKSGLVIEIIFMTYSYVHRAINNEAFPNAVELYDPSLMTGRGRGRYCYRDEQRAQVEQFLRVQIQQKLGESSVLYVV
jgi:spore photoproduct lyase